MSNRYSHGNSTSAVLELVLVVGTILVMTLEVIMVIGMETETVIAIVQVM